MYVHFASVDSAANQASTGQTSGLRSRPTRPTNQTSAIPWRSRPAADEVLLINNRAAQIYTSAAGERRVYQIVYSRQRARQASDGGGGGAYRGRVGLAWKHKTETASARNQLVNVARSRRIASS